MGASWVTALRLSAAANVMLLINAWLNSRYLPNPAATNSLQDFDESVSILVPVRDEMTNIVPLLDGLTRQIACPNLEILIADDSSLDETANLIESYSKKSAANIKLLRLKDELPPGWLGKTRACQELANHANGAILVFIDADVRLAPQAISASCKLLRSGDLALLSPYPKQIADGRLGRLIQPLLQWSWLTFVPLRLSESPLTPASLTAANGQFLVCDANAYRAVGGHAAVQGEVIEDVALARQFKKHGFSVGMANGTELATCQMYSTDQALSEGYSKSLWRAFGSPAGAVLASAALSSLYVLPALGALLGAAPARRAGSIGYLAAVGQRAISARTTGGRVWPDSLSQPASIVALIGLIARSVRQHRQGKLTWRRRGIPTR